MTSCPHADRSRHRPGGPAPLRALVAGLLVVALALPLAGCGVRHYFHADEKRLATQGKIDSLHHLAAYYPGGIFLNSPGYLVTIEDSAPDNVSRPGDLGIEHVTGAGSGLRRVEDQLIERKLPFVSQVYRYTGAPYGTGNCALYNLYRTAESPTIAPCEDALPAATTGPVDHRAAYRDSWQAIDILGAALQQDIASGDYSHLVVMMMGLDTPQYEAVIDFNSLVWSIRQAGGTAFRPLVVGITWPSFFHSRWLDPIWEALAYHEKADEADKLGLSWVGVLMHEAIIPLGADITTVAITHSFGTRSISMGTCVGPAIKPPAAATRRLASGSLDLLIGLAPAFSLQRFNAQRLLFFEDIYYPNGCDRADMFVLTTTNHDNASKMPIWSDLAGNYRYYKEFCSRDFPFQVDCVSADRHGNLADGAGRTSKVLYIDTTELMRYEVPETQGGAHTDIFRREVGQLLWSVLSTRAR